MKKIIAALVFTLMVLPACQPDPIISLDREKVEIDPAGGTQTIYLTANNSWNSIVEDQLLSVSPGSGEGSGNVSVTLPANTSGKNRSMQVVFVCSSKDMSMTKVLTVLQDSMPVPDDKTDSEYDGPADSGFHS